MKHGTVGNISLMCAIFLAIACYALVISETTITIYVVTGVILFLFSFFMARRSNVFAMSRDRLELDEPAETVDEINKLESTDAHKMFRRVGMIFLIALLSTFITGCASQLMWVDYGLERMAPADKVRLGEILNTAPDGRRVSWYNKSSNSQYTITPVQSYWAPGGQDSQGKPGRRACREYLVDDVYPYTAPKDRRGHMQITEFACYDPHLKSWYAINGHSQRPWITIGGPNYFDRRRN